MLHVHREDATRGEERERRQLQAWLLGCVNDLLAAMGLGEGWWCAIDLPRAELFGDGTSGDVDVLAGPLGFNLDAEAWTNRVELATAASGPQFAARLAELGAEIEGLVAWPPEIGYTVAVEVKASYYTERWGATHSGKAGKILGALRERARYGINRLAFLHLAAATPSPDVDTMERRAEEAGPIPLICDPARFGRFGYAAGMMSVVADADQAVWGALDGLDWRNPPEILGSPKYHAWHDTLRARFAEMPVPRSVRTYIHRCPACSSWMHAGSACPDSYRCFDCSARDGKCAWIASAVPAAQRNEIRRSAGLVSG